MEYHFKIRGNKFTKIFNQSFLTSLPSTSLGAGFVKYRETPFNRNKKQVKPERKTCVLQSHHLDLCISTWLHGLCT